MVACVRRYGGALVASNCTSRSRKSSYIDSGVSIRQYVVRDVTQSARPRSGARPSRRTRFAHRSRQSSSLPGAPRRACSRRARVPVEPADARKAAVLFIDLDGFKPINDHARPRRRRRGARRGRGASPRIDARNRSGRALRRRRIRRAARGSRRRPKFSRSQSEFFARCASRFATRTTCSPFAPASASPTARPVSQAEEGSEAPVDGASAAADLLRARRHRDVRRQDKRRRSLRARGRLDGIARRRFGR